MSYTNYRRPTKRRTFSTQPRSRSRQPRKDYIHPSRFIQSAKLASEPEYVPTHTFSDFVLHPIIYANLQEMGFDTPSPIQDQSIPVGLSGRDVVGLADTGTGKTAAFAIPLLQSLLTKRDTRALILAPTRELAQQIEEACRRIAKGSGLSGALLIGGVPMRPQHRDLKSRPRIVIGTPGRVKDHIEQGTLPIQSFNLVVLDEVDRMLDMGFVNDIRHILHKTASQKQSFFFSATLDSRVRGILDEFSKEPVHVTVKSNDASKNVEQNVVRYNSLEEKISKLHDLLIQDPVTKTLVFDDTHRSVEKLSKELQARGFNADAIHGGKSQSQRQRALKRFKDTQVNILVATDVAARGIDVVDISHVVNYSTPQSYSDYIHRIGRAGRAGRVGHALTFIDK
jgi:ATP-dependent RNA helicase RhlE